MSDNKIFYDNLLDTMGRADIADDTPYNYCIECKSPMEAIATEYCCKYCGLTSRNDLDASKISSGGSRGTIRVGNGSIYYFNGGCSEIQHKTILNQLTRLQFHSEIYILPNVLMITAEKYNLVQKHAIEIDTDNKGNVLKKKFVRRGNIKDEILATILYYECMNAGIGKYKREIAKFMNLPTDGFARGEDIVRTLVENGDIDLIMDCETAEAFVDRYMSTLSITDSRYSEFVVALVKASEEYHIGMSSQLSSKVVGAIWIVIQQCNLAITWKVLEVATDNTKKNTFNKFSKVVFDNIGRFTPIFDKYRIPI